MIKKNLIAVKVFGSPFSIPRHRLANRFIEGGGMVAEGLLEFAVIDDKGLLKLVEHL